MRKKVGKQDTTKGFNRFNEDFNNRGHNWIVVAATVTRPWAQIDSKAIRLHFDSTFISAATYVKVCWRFTEAAQTSGNFLGGLFVSASRE